MFALVINAANQLEKSWQMDFLIVFAQQLRHKNAVTVFGVDQNVKIGLENVLENSAASKFTFLALMNLLAIASTVLHLNQSVNGVQKPNNAWTQTMSASVRSAVNLLEKSWQMEFLIVFAQQLRHQNAVTVFGVDQNVKIGLENVLENFAVSKFTFLALMNLHVIV